MEPAMSRDGKRFMCANKGCVDKSFLQEENHETACQHHVGEPVFHDLKKYWSCCKDKVTWDFDDFMKIETCTKSAHVIRYKEVKKKK